MPCPIRRTVAAALLLAGLSAPGHAQTARYPDQPVKIVVPFAAGGGTDVAGRVVAQKLTEALGQSFIVENRVGASGMVGTEAVAKSPADGYTLLVASQTTLAVVPALYPKFNVDASKQFSGVGMIGISPLVGVVHPAVPAQNARELIALAKAKPGTINFGSGGLGTTPHMAGELFALTAGIKLTHIAYRGEAPALNDVIGGQIPFMFSNLSAALGNVKAGQVRGACRHHREARDRRAGNSDRRRGGAARLRGGDLVRAGRAGRHAARRGPADQRRDEADFALPDVKQRFADLGMTDRGQHAGRARRLHQVRNREVGEGHQGRRHQGAGLTRLFGALQRPISAGRRNRDAADRAMTGPKASDGANPRFLFRPKPAMTVASGGPARRPLGPSEAIDSSREFV